LTETGDREGTGPDVDPEAALEELRRLRDRPPPSDPSSGGCALAAVAIIAIVLMPFIGRGFDLPGRVMGTAGAALGLIALVGGLVGIFGGGRARGGQLSEALAALDALPELYAAGDREASLRAAVTVLDGALVTYGPKTVSAFDPDEAARRLGPALDYVMRVERVLVQRNEIAPVFTRG